MITYLVKVPTENYDALDTLCECMGWKWSILQNSTNKIISIQSKEHMIQLFKRLDGGVYTIIKEEK